MTTHKVSPEQLADWSTYVAEIKACTTPAQVGAIYVDLVGYDAHDEEPAASLEYLQGLALDYLREVCAEFGVHVSEIGL